MKMKKLIGLAVPVMMMASLTGCDNSAQYNEFCARAADAAPLLMNSATGKEIYSSEKVRVLDEYNSVLALNTYTFAGKEMAFTWELSPKDKWVSSTYVVDATRNKLTPVYGQEAFEADVKCTVSILEKGKKHGKAELSWKFRVEPTTVVELSLKQINENYVNNNNSLGNMGGKDAEGNDIIIGTRGIITSTFEAPDDVYSGVFISDGEYSLQLYAGKITDLWKENQLKVGDCVFAVGPLSIYGAIEMKPSLLDPIDAAAYNIKAPVTIDLANKTFDGKTLMVNQSSLVTLADCKYKSGNVAGESAHATVMFTHGETDITVYVNYHIGKTAMNAVKELISGYKAGETTVTIKGVLGFYDGNPQIVPIFGVNSFIAAA